MATTPSHAVQSGLIMYYALKLLAFIPISIIGFIRHNAGVASEFSTAWLGILATFLITLAAVAGALPDIVGELEPEDSDDPENKKWAWYTVMHTRFAAWSAKHLQYVYTIFIVIHVWEDKYFHDLGTGKWLKMGYVYEGVIDVVLLAVIALEVF